MPLRAGAHQIILGIDPSLRGTGYGVIRMANRSPGAGARHDCLSAQLGTFPLPGENFQTLRDVLGTASARTFAWWKACFSRKI